MDRNSLTNFDRRISGQKTMKAAQRDAEQKLKQLAPGATVDFEPLLGSPKWIHGNGALLTGKDGVGRAVSGPTAKQFGGDPDKALKAFLQEHRALFRHGPEVLNDVVKKRESTTQHGLTTKVWEQQVDGIPVFDSVLIAHTTTAGELISISSQFLPDPKRAADLGTPNRVAKARAPTIDVRHALEIAAANVGEDISDIAAIEPEPGRPLRGQRFHAKPLPGEASVALVWLPLDGDTLRLCWEVELNRREFSERFRFVIDTETGEVWLRRKLTVEVSEVFYRVYTSDSPSPMSPGLSVPTNTQPPYAPRVLLSISNLSAAASPLGWINDGGLETRGNNVDAHLDRDDDDRADLPRIQGTLTNWVVDGVTNTRRIFDFPVDFSQPATAYSPAAIVQLFYWCNFMHDRLYDLGFTEAAGNFQKDNFGHGGFDNDPIMADAQDGSGFNNANFTPSRDGASGKIQMYVFNGPNPSRDGDLDAEVICHEYTHGLSDRLIGGGVGITSLQTAGMGEGWSDFYAEALLSEYGDDLGGNYPMGGYATYQFSGLTQNYYYGIRRYPYSTNLNVDPLTFKDIDPTVASSHPGIPKSPIITSSGGEVHRQGEVWCSMLWDMRAFLLRKHAPTSAADFTTNNMRVLRYVTIGLQLCPPNPNFLQARDAILQAVMRSGLGHPDDTNEVWKAFARRGLGLSAVCPESSTTIGVIEAYDTPQQPEFDVQPRSAITFTGPPGGPFFSNAVTTTLFNSTGSNVAWAAGVQLTNTGVPWLQLSASTGVLAANSSSDVVASLAPGAVTLPETNYSATIYFTNFLRTQVVTRVVSLDVRAGQPPPDPLLITPSETFVVTGPLGGPFSPPAKLYRLSNVGDTNPIPWQAWSTNNWLSVTSSFGVLNPKADTNDVVVSVNTNAIALANGLYAGAISILNSNSGVTQFIPVSLRVGEMDYFAEDFSFRTSNDLDLSMLTLTPDGSINYYSACHEPADRFPTDPADGVPLTLADDQYLPVTLTNSHEVSIFGVRSNTIYIGANGNVTFDPGVNTNAFYPGIDEFFAHPRVAPLYADLNPTKGGTVSYKELEDRFVVTWQNVPEFSPADDAFTANSAQAELFYDGRIRMTWLQTQITNLLFYVIGVSRGDGFPENFISSDLSAYKGCGPTATLVLPSRTSEPPDGVMDGQIVQPSMVVLIPPSENDVIVTISSSDTNEITVVDGTFTIPKGSNYFNFEVRTLNDGIPDGTQPVTITATFSDRDPVSVTMLVDDAPPGSDALLYHVPRDVREGEVLKNAGRVLMEDSFVRTKPLSINLHSSDPSRVLLPPKVIIPPGTNAANFDIALPENNLIEGTNQVEIQFSIPNWPEVSATIHIADNESRALGLSLPAEVIEGQGAMTNAGRVVLGGIATTNVAIALQSSDPALISVPAFVTNMAGSSNAFFTITVLNNQDVNATNLVGIFANSAGFTTATGVVSVIDDERPFEPTNPSPENFATHVRRDTLLSWSINSSALPTTRYTVYFGIDPNLAATSPIATNITEKSTPLPYELEPDMTYYWQVKAELEGFDPVFSPVWQFHTSPVQYEFAAIASPQFAGEPFPISILARDEWGLPVLNHTAQLTLTNSVPSGGNSSIVVTEIETTGLRAAEFMNVSTKSINVAGWKIYLYDTISWPAPAVAFTIPSPSVAAPGELFMLRNLPLSFFPGTYPNFATGTNVAWNENLDNNPVAVLLVDNVGNMVDFACASGADPAAIYSPGPIPLEQWSGPAIPANADTSQTYQRFGSHDSNNVNDWRAFARSTRTNNVGLTAPFTGLGSVPFTATPLQVFRSGVCTGTVTMLEPALGLVLGVSDTQGRAASSPPFDVLARNDISLSARPLDTAAVGEPITYQFTVTNTGPSVATAVRLIDGISSNAQFTAAVPSQGGCVVTNNRVICDFGTVAPATAASVGISAFMSSRGTITNFSTVTRGEADGYISNNSVALVTTVAYPQVAIFNASIIENSPTGLVNFSLTLSASSSQTTSVAFATSDGTAAGGVDYQPMSGVVTFAPGVTNRTISVPIFDDSMSESNETFFISLFNPTNLDITRQMGVGTISDNDPSPQLTVSDATVTETDNGTTNLVFRVQLSVASGRVVNVGYATASGTALAGLDFLETYGTLIFPPGVTNATVVVAVLGDTTPEPTKVFALNLANAGNAIIARGQGVGTIIDNDVELVSTFTFGPIVATNHAGLPTPVTITARNSAGDVATNFNDAATLFASTLPQPIVIGSNSTTTWSLPLGTGFHDARLQSIYLSNEVSGAGTIVGLSLDVVTPPAQVLSNFTIRIRHTTKDRYVAGEWENAGWVTNCQRDVLVSGSGWVYFPFSTPFAYNGRDNIMIDFSFDNSSFSADGLCRSTAVPTQRSLSLRTDSFYGPPLDWPLDGIRTKPSGQLSARVPNVQLLAGGTVGLQPLGTSVFTNGVWAGIVTVTNGAENVVLRAVDGVGHFGESAPFTLLTLKLVNLTRTGNGLSLDFPSVAGRQYVIETNSSPSGLGWGAASAVISGDGSVVQFQHIPLVTPQFYRLRLLP